MLFYQRTHWVFALSEGFTHNPRRKADAYTKQANEIRAQIKIVLEAIQHIYEDRQQDL